MIFLFKVEDVFQISGRGCVIVPAAPSGNLRIRVGDRIQLRTPDGRIVDTHVAGIEMVCGGNARDCAPICLPGDIAKPDVPAGTEVWTTQVNNSN